MPASTIVVPAAQTVGYNVQDIADKLEDVATKAKADINTVGNGITYHIGLSADTGATAATAETVVDRVAIPGTATKVYWIPGATVTGNASNNATINVYKRVGTGATAAIVSLTTTATATAFVPVDLGALTNAVMAAGTVLTVAISKGGTGVQLPASRLQVVLGS